jgi:hypothetical protein
MKLLLQSNNQLTRYAKSGEYATTTAIPLDGPLALTDADPAGMAAIATRPRARAVGQVFIEPDGTHSEYETTVDAEGVESQVVTSTRAKLSAAVTAHAAAGITLRSILKREPFPRNCVTACSLHGPAIEGMP